MAGKSTKKKFPISADAMKAYHYQELHRENPTRKLYVLHTIRKRCKAIGFFTANKSNKLFHI
jgi:hypothetical protein